MKKERKEKKRLIPVLGRGLGLIPGLDPILSPMWGGNLMTHIQFVSNKGKRNEVHYNKKYTYNFCVHYHIYIYI